MPQQSRQTLHDPPVTSGPHIFRRIKPCPACQLLNHARHVEWGQPTRLDLPVPVDRAAGTRIGLDVVVYDFRDGRSAEAIFEAYPSIGSLATVYGAITFILEHPNEIEAYLGDQDRRYEEFKAQHPLTPDMIERFERGSAKRA